MNERDVVDCTAFLNDLHMRHELTARGFRFGLEKG